MTITALGAAGEVIHNINAGLPTTRSLSSPSELLNSTKNIYHEEAKSWPCLINVFRLQAWLDGYQEQSKKELLTGIKFGFQVQSSLPFRLGGDYTNHRSALQHVTKINEKLSKELLLHRIAGPFDRPPPGLILSPLAAVPKKDSGDIRLIHDLSFPKGNSVNDFIPREYCSVSYELIDDCIEHIVNIGKGCLISKADIANAFRIIPIHPDSYYLLGFTWEGKFYFDKSLAMGCSNSCNTFEKLSTAIQWIMINKFNVTCMSHILDDFMFFGRPGTQQCAHSLYSFIQFAESIGITLKQEKTVHPSTSVELHGLLIDTMTMQVRLPEDKLIKARESVLKMSKKKNTTLKELQSLIGLLSFCCRAIRPGRAFLRRLTDLTMGKSNPGNHIRLNSQARADLACWTQFLKAFNGVQLMKQEIWTSTNSFKLFSDASFLACAALFGSKWLRVEFPPQWSSVHIAPKELLPISLAFRYWAPLLKDSNIVFLVDNISVVHVINNKTSKDKIMMALIRQMMVTALFFNIQFCSRHIPGRHNLIPDLLSRLQDSKARSLAPWLSKSQVQVPTDWLPW